jgi:hypothetical protein
VWVATRDALWTLTGVSVDTATATLAWRLPPDLDTFSLAIPKPARVFGLSRDGTLYAAERTGVTRVYKFNAPDSGVRGEVVTDTGGVLAVFGEERVIVRVSDDGRVSEQLLPTTAEGAVSIARFGDYGVVVGTSGGNLRAESLGYEVIVDPLGRTPGPVPIRALAEIDGRLYYAGTTGLFGELTPGGFVCTSEARATSSARFIGANAGEILVAGRPLSGSPREVQLSRFAP